MKRVIRYALFLFGFILGLKTDANDFQKWNTRARSAKFFSIGMLSGFVIANQSIDNQKYAQNNPGARNTSNLKELVKFMPPQVFRALMSAGVITSGDILSRVKIGEWSKLVDLANGDKTVSNVYEHYSGLEISSIIGEPDKYDHAIYFTGDALAQFAVDAYRQKHAGQPFTFQWNPSMIFAATAWLYIWKTRTQENQIKEEPKMPVSKSWFPVKIRFR